MNPPVSACIVCFNEKDNIKKCLESVKWCDEIIVVDSGSTDGTVEICRQYTDKVHHNKWPGFVAQKNHALSLASNDWVLSLDADEYLSDELQTEIKSIWEKGETTVHAGFYAPRKTFYLGRWILHGGWYPDYKLRLWKKILGKWDGIDPHDRVALSQGNTLKLNNPIIHNNYIDLSDQLSTVNKFSSTAAEALIKEGKSFSFINLVFRPPIKFIENYFFKLGFLDGMAGLIIAVNSAFYVFNKYAKMWEIKKKDK
jgi:glycosyltransferase involved in cell wall biosynthesis